MGKYTLKSIVGEIDKKVVELGSIGGRIFRYLCFFLSSSFGNPLTAFKAPKLVFRFRSLGHLVTRFAEKGVTYCTTSNPMERTIVWTTVVPKETYVVIDLPLLVNVFVKILYVLIHSITMNATLIPLCTHMVYKYVN